MKRQWVQWLANSNAGWYCGGALAAAALVCCAAQCWLGIELIRDGHVELGSVVIIAHNILGVINVDMLRRWWRHRERKSYTMKWFGKHFGISVCDEHQHVAIPVGETCPHCAEAIAADDSGIIDDVGAVHAECFMRLVFGGINHQKGLCSCPGCAGTEPPDPPDVSIRQAAFLALKYWHDRHRPLMEPPKPVTHATYAAVYEKFARMAIDQFNDRGEMPHTFYGVTVDDAATDGDEVNVTSVIEFGGDFAGGFYRDDSRKNLIKPFIRALLHGDTPLRRKLIANKVPLPNLVVQVSELWMATDIIASGATTDLRSPVPPSERPDHQEGIGVFVHSINKTVAQCCPIRNTPQRHAEFAPVENIEWMTGRISMSPESGDDPNITKH